MAEKAPPSMPPYCAVFPEITKVHHAIDPEVIKQSEQYVFNEIPVRAVMTILQALWTPR